MLNIKNGFRTDIIGVGELYIKAWIKSIRERSRQQLFELSFSLRVFLLIQVSLAQHSNRRALGSSPQVARSIGHGQIGYRGREIILYYGPHFGNIGGPWSRRDLITVLKF